MKVRIKFSKSGVMKYIGHLDIMRYFQKLLRRADIPVAYSQGMSPHQIMSFAMPLGIGLESEAEYVDIEITDKISSAEAIDRMNAHNVCGINILSFKMLPDNAVNAMASIYAALYDVRFKEGHEPDFSCIDILKEMYGKPGINILKQTKKSESVVDIKPGIFSFEGDDTHILMCLSCGSRLNIKPGQVMDAIYAANGKEAGRYAFAVTRKEMYTLFNGGMLSLDEIGTEII
ncbi:MAG: TIGR03936 family radical SAM-associated protein [Lachnospiraceae bacterium]|nr:TIGR03936 family radical SAM-associated protein [Lachnospiraceae bacterium]